MSEQGASSVCPHCGAEPHEHMAGVWDCGTRKDGGAPRSSERKLQAAEQRIAELEQRVAIRESLLAEMQPTAEAVLSEAKTNRAKVAELERENARLVSATSALIGYASTAATVTTEPWLSGFVQRINAASEAVGSSVRYEADGEDIRVIP